MIKPCETNCSGCGICENICSHGAIVMKEDELGFFYPEVNHSLCIDCGACDVVCPFNKIEKKTLGLQKVYAARNKNPEIINLSRSGGVFSALTEVILNNGGSVYGAVLNNRMQVKHEKAESYEKRNLMRGSKYTQSDMGDICKEVKKDLEEGRQVLFSGTPCQVAAIDKFISKRLKSNLYLVDIICHGVGSPKVWSEFVSFIENSKGCKLAQVDFRDKNKYGWDGIHKESFKFRNENKSRYIPYIYYNDLHLRECCQYCPYTSVQRISDITLGDLWGWNNVVPEWKRNNNGISLILVNSEAGNKLWDECTDKVESKIINIKSVMQPHLLHPLKVDREARNNYSNDFKNKPFIFVLEKYHKISRPSIFKILYNKLRILIPR